MLCMFASGILLNMFAFGTESFKEVDGRPNVPGGVRLKLRVAIGRDLEEDENDRYVSALGKLGLGLHFPTEVMHLEVINQFRSQIETCGGDFNKWASGLVIRVTNKART